MTSLPRFASGLFQLRRFAYPVVLSSAAWNRALHQDPTYPLDAFGRRLAFLVQAAYQELMNHPDETRVRFTLDLSLMAHDPEACIALELSVVTPGGEPPYLHIALQGERPSTH